MKVSFNEVETLSKRAAHGAGYSWGLADEAGKAVRWLTAHGFPGLDILLEILRNERLSPDAQAQPVFADGVWQSLSGVLSPIVAGAILCDRAGQITRVNAIRFNSVHLPLTLAPYVASAARISNSCFELSWDNTVMTFGGHDSTMIGHNTGPQLATIATVHCRCIAKLASPPLKPIAVCSADPDVWAGLNRFAHRMFAPASEASRLAGAGAGLTDND